MSEVNLRYVSADSVRVQREMNDYESPVELNAHYETLSERLELPMVARTTEKSTNEYVRYACDGVPARKNDASDSNHRNSATEKAESGQECHNYTNLPSFRSKVGGNGRCIIVSSVLCGVMCGIAATSVCWLTLNEFKERRITCNSKGFADMETNADSTPTLSSSHGKIQTLTELELTTSLRKRRSRQGGFVYIRWGRRFECPSHAKQVNKGKRLCNNNVPCIACVAIGRMSHLMIPGRTECFTGWTMEYRGYLMGSSYEQSPIHELMCVDSEPNYIIGRKKTKSAIFWSLAEVRFGLQHTPSDVNRRELACVVCTM